MIMVSRMTNLKSLSTLDVTDDRLRLLVDAGVAGYMIAEEERELRLYVVFVENERGRIPWELVEEESIGKAMIEAANIYGEGWTISVLDAEVVPICEMERLALSLSILDNWDEFLGLPEGTCHVCGGTGIITKDECIDGHLVEMYGDCEGCAGSGQL
jgi:hypothetical protein